MEKKVKEGSKAATEARKTARTSSRKAVRKEGVEERVEEIKVESEQQVQPQLEVQPQPEALPQPEVQVQSEVQPKPEVLPQPVQQQAKPQQQKHQHESLGRPVPLDPRGTYTQPPPIRTIENEKMFTVDLRDLRKKNIAELNDLATILGIEDHSRLKKSELVFKILKKQSEKNGFLFGGGVLEITPNGYGFLRSQEYNYKQSYSDIYVSPAQIKKFALKNGDTIVGQLRPPTNVKDNENYFALLRIEMINKEHPEECKKKTSFEDLTPIFPNEKFRLEHDPKQLSTRIIDMFAPIGKGQRALLVAPPKSGKTVLLQDIAKALVKNHPEAYLIVLLIDERPEEVTDFARNFNGNENVEVVASTFDEDPKNHIHLTEVIKEKSKRLVEHGKDVVVLLDSITRMTRAYNSTLTSSGRVLSGGIDANAFSVPKSFFGAARKIENGGSLTIIGTALVDTGSKMDEVIFEEFKGTGNMELALDRKLADKRIFPAIEVIRSGTRREELQLPEDILQKVWVLRKILSDLTQNEAIEFLIDNLSRYKTNKEFLQNINS